MPRKRVIYQSEALYVGPTPATGAHYSSGNSGVNQVLQLHRVQSANYSFNVSRQDVQQFGQLAAIDRVIMQAPTVNLDLSYYLIDGINEKRLGFLTDGVTSTISGILNGSTDAKNYFISTSAEGSDAVGSDPVNRNVIAIGNGFISNYSINAAVGSLPTASVTIEGLNIKVDATASGNAIPAVNPADGTAITTWNYQLPMATGNVSGALSALRPGDVTIALSTQFGAEVTGAGAANFQNVSIQLPLSRQPLDRLGSKFSFSKEVQYPLSVTLSASAMLADLKSGNLADILCNDADYDLTVTIRQPSCAGLGPVSLQYIVKKAKLDSQSFSSSIGSNKTVDLSFSAPIAGPQDTTRGLFISGAYQGV